jgi:hypothetical protein
MLKIAVGAPSWKRRSSKQLDLPSQHVPAFAGKALKMHNTVHKSNIYPFILI